MILHNQQAVPRFQIHRFSLFFASFFPLIFHDFSCFFEVRFQDRFWIAFLMEKGTKMTSKIDPQGDPFPQKASQRVPLSPGRSVLEPTFFRASIFRCFLVPFRRPFGQCWALLAPFWPLLAPCWALLAPFWEHFGRSWLIFARTT